MKTCILIIISIFFPLKAIRSLSFLIVIKLCNPLLTQSHGDADSKVVQSH